MPRRTGRRVARWQDLVRYILNFRGARIPAAAGQLKTEILFVTFLTART